MNHSQINAFSGIDIAFARRFDSARGARVGVLSNLASVDKAGRHLVDLIDSSANCYLAKLFAPEHGFMGQAQDMEAVENRSDPKTGIEIVSLYGNSEDSLKPDPEHFSDIDVLIVDLCDIGTRYYTYSQTLAYCMETAGQTKTKIIVLDRPNPIGGDRIEGSPLEKPNRSFCGIGPFANRHGMTLGELALMFQKGFGEGPDALEARNCDLEVVKVEGWKRSLYLDHTDIPWVNPSPNMQSLEAAIAYPGTCLFEATNLSEGRGTDSPFTQIGAPYVDPSIWIEAICSIGLPIGGVAFESTTFTPAFQKHAGQRCQGLQIRIQDRNSFQPYRCGIAMLIAAAKAFPKNFAWRSEPYEFKTDTPAIDLLYGSPALRNAIEDDLSIDKLDQQMESFESWYKTARAEFLIY